MGIRIQPLEIEIPADDPFKYDLLDRRESITALTHIIRSIDGPCVLAVDAPWGAGKTTFLKIWEQHLRNENFPVVSFNAWETDFSDDPFIALSDAILQELEQYKRGSLGDSINKFGKLATAVVRVTVPPAIKVSTGGLIDVAPLVDLLKEIPQALAPKTSDRMATYQKAQELLKALSGALQDVARDLARSKNGLPLVIVIDELDRCRPSYAVELLEAAKHIFAVDHVVFVLAVNRSELAYSVRALYGSEFDAIGYLNRFFDIDFRLPEITRKQFIESALDATRLSDYLKNTKDQSTHRYNQEIKDLLETFFDVADLNLRTIAQAIHRLGLVLASSSSDPPSFALATVVALIVRTVDLELYRRFINGEIVDREVVDSIYDRPEYNDVPWQMRTHFEAVIIVAAQENEGAVFKFDSIIPSPLHTRYKDISEARQPNAPYGNESSQHAEDVIRAIRVLNYQTTNTKVFPFKDAVRRLELLSTEAVDEILPRT